MFSVHSENTQIKSNGAIVTHRMVVRTEHNDVSFDIWSIMRRSQRSDMMCFRVTRTIGQFNCHPTDLTFIIV